MTRRSSSLLFAIVLLALAARIGLLALRWDELTVDRDAYLGIAAALGDGYGFASPGTRVPTAYRPPLYPLLVALSPTSHLAIWVATLNVLSGAATVILAAALGQRLGLSKSASGVAAGLVAIDPLLVRYASQPMTESLCTLLVTAWLLALLTCLERSTVARGWWCGVLIGLCGLCRPTIWSTAGLVGVWFLWRAWRRRTERSDSGAAEVRLAGSDLRPVLAGLAGTLLVIAPWVVRNMVVFGRPILTTTHGGYTLLLGNNPSFYGEVVRQEWGAVWDGSHGQGQTGWVEGLQTEMQLEDIVGEVAQDQWMNDRGWNNICADLGGFLQAAMLRLVRFWNVLPMGDARSGWSGRVLTSIACFYSAQWLLMFAGVVDVVRRRVVAYGPALLLLLSFTAVHLVYWSNVRMRAPLVPVLAILAVHGAEVIRRKFRRVNGVANPASSA